MQQIASHQNKNFKLWLDCLQSKGVQTHHRAILAGKKVINDVIKTHLSVVKACLMPEKTMFATDPVYRDLVSKGQVPCFELQHSLFNELDIFGTKCPLLVVSVPQIEKFDTKLNGPALFIPFQDPKNVGAVLRSAAAFGVKKIILAKSACHPFHPESLRAASGCVFDHQFYKADLLELSECTTVALDMSGISLDKFKFPKDFIFVPGIEGQGLDKNFDPTHKITIPMHSNVESLNAMAATTVALYQWSLNP